MTHQREYSRQYNIRAPEAMSRDIARPAISALMFRRRDLFELRRRAAGRQ
jgi:hypothetical protein